MPTPPAPSTRFTPVRISPTPKADRALFVKTAFIVKTAFSFLMGKKKKFSGFQRKEILILFDTKWFLQKGLRAQASPWRVIRSGLKRGTGFWSAEEEERTLTGYSGARRGSRACVEWPRVAGRAGSPWGRRVTESLRARWKELSLSVLPLPRSRPFKPAWSLRTPAGAQETPVTFDHQCDHRLLSLSALCRPCSQPSGGCSQQNDFCLHAAFILLVIRWLLFLCAIDQHRGERKGIGNNRVLFTCHWPE